MPTLQSEDRGTAGFFLELGLALYPQDRLYEEMSFLSYYFHWSNDEVMNMDHLERRRWCRQVSQINKKLSKEDKNRIEFK